jgi:hypothetical protein
VAFIYENDKKTPYNVLENRYFKLRKKVMDELQSGEEVDVGALFTEEELKFNRCKNLLLVENKEEAFRQLTELEKDCWEKNIFELLPGIIDQLIFFNQSFNRNEHNKEIYDRLDNAIELQYDMQRFSRVARQIYEINYAKGIKHAKKEFNTLKELATKHKNYPRFLMCYHHLCMYYKLGSADYIHEMQVISRHVSEFKKLYAKHPLMPLINYKVNYVKFQHFHFHQSTMFYHFNRCEFREADACMNEVWDLVNGSDSIFRMYKTESLYSNVFYIKCMAGKYDEANKTSDQFLAFLKENNQMDKLTHGYVQKAKLYADMHPNTGILKMDPGFLNAQVDEYIRQVRKADNVQLSLDQILALKIKLLLIEGKPAKAKEILQENIVKEHLSELRCYEFFEELILLMSQRAKNYEGLAKKVQVAKYKAMLPGEVMHLKWIAEFIKKLK